MARLRVRLGADRAELFVFVAATPWGLTAQVRPLAVDGRIEALARSELRRCPTCGAFRGRRAVACDRDGTVLEDVVDDPRPGGTVGVYRLREPLGEGGMGVVYAAEHALIGRRVAVKVLHPSIAAPHAARLFLSEARAASRIRHPSLVDVTDFGLVADGRPFVVMELLAGEPLDVHLDRRGALPPDVALRIAREVALGLAAAHDGGVVHNDLKPSNVMLLEGSTDETVRLKILDFGAAVALHATAAHVDDPIGTPLYMAPERIQGAAPDARSDLYSLGVVLYQMLSGAPPFAASAPAEVLLAHTAKKPAPPASPFGVLPRAVVQLAFRALAKKPAERHQSGAELALDLERALAATARPGFLRWMS